MEFLIEEKRIVAHTPQEGVTVYWGRERRGFGTGI